MARAWVLSMDHILNGISIKKITMTFADAITLVVLINLLAIGIAYPWFDKYEHLPFDED